MDKTIFMDIYIVKAIEADEDATKPMCKML